MKLRTTALLITMSVAWIAWFVSALAVQSHRYSVQHFEVAMPADAEHFKPESPVYPPEQYQGPNAAVVVFAGMAQLQELCSSEPAQKGHVYLGCAAIKDDGTPVIALPDPCLLPHSDFYAALACHELGHINGWSHDEKPPAKAAPPPQEDQDPTTIAMRHSGGRAG